MHIQTINYTRTFNLGNYSSEKIGVEFALNEGESATKALDYARELVEEYHKQNLIKLIYKVLSLVREGKNANYSNNTINDGFYG